MLVLDGCRRAAAFIQAAVRLGCARTVDRPRILRALQSSAQQLLEHRDIANGGRVRRVYERDMRALCTPHAIVEHGLRRACLQLSLVALLALRSLRWVVHVPLAQLVGGRDLLRSRVEMRLGVRHAVRLESVDQYPVAVRRC